MRMTAAVLYVSIIFRFCHCLYIMREWHIRRLAGEACSVLVLTCLTYVSVRNIRLSRSAMQAIFRAREVFFVAMSGRVRRLSIIRLEFLGCR